MKPTIDEQIKWQKQLLRNYPQAEFEGNAILTSLERLKQIDAQELVACNWKYIEDGYWQTDCGESFCLEEGTPEQNGMKYCHHCGKPLYTKPEAK